MIRILPLLFLAFGLSLKAENRIPNSSFEAGAGRGWVAWGGLGEAANGNLSALADRRTNDAFHGGSSMLVRSGGRLLGRSVYLTNGTYTFTMYAKRPGGTQGPYQFGMMNWVTLTNEVNPPGSANFTGSWARYTNTFTVLTQGMHWPKFYTAAQPDFLIDAVQVEAGTNATAYAPQATIEVGLSIPATNNLWFAGGSTPVFNLNFWNHGVGAIPRVIYNVYDAWNSNVLSGTAAIPIAAGTNTSASVSLPNRSGWFRITSRIATIDDSYDEATTIIYPYTLDLATHQTNDWLGGHPHPTPFHTRRELLTARKWGRMLSPNGGIRWEVVEPTRGNFVWTDSTVTNHTRDGMNLLACLTPITTTSWQLWATNADGTLDFMAWSNYCYQVVNRYKDYIKTWEVGPNEPYQGGYTNPINQYSLKIATNYAVALTYGVRGVTNADPTAKIVAMAGAYGGGDWAKEAWTNLTAETQAAIHYVSTHIYTQEQGGDPDAVGNVDPAFTNAKAWITNWAGIRPVWNTESGAYDSGPILGMNGAWPVAYDFDKAYTPESWRNERMQRQLITTQRLLREALRDIGYGFQKFFYYDSRAFNDGTWNGTSPYGNDYMQVDRPANASLSIATHFIRAGLGRITNAATAHLEMYHFTNAVGQTVAAAWCYDITNRTVTLTNSSFALYDAMGNLQHTNQASAIIERIPKYLVSGTMTTAGMSNALRFATVTTNADVTAPKISIDIAPSGTWTGGSALLKWSALDDRVNTWTNLARASNILYRYKFNSGAFTEYTQTNFIRLDLAAGNHTLYVGAKDLDGNASEISYIFEPQAAGGASGNTATSAHIGTLQVGELAIPPPFSPTNIAGLKLWLNPDVGTFQTSGGAAAVADADPVGQIQDQSGLGNHAGNVTSTKRPTLKLATHNGKNTILWDGVDDNWITASVAHGIGAGDCWFVCVAKVGATGAYLTLFTVAPPLQVYIHNLKLHLFTTIDRPFDTILTAGTFHIFEVMRVGTTVKGYIDGVQEATSYTVATSIPTGVFRVGSDNGSVDFYNSNTGQTLLYAGSPTVQQRADLINYLGAYYGVAVTP